MAAGYGLAAVPEGLGGVRLIGIVEFAAALGLVLPALTGIAPVLTPLAATGLAWYARGAVIS